MRRYDKESAGEKIGKYLSRAVVVAVLLAAMRHLGWLDMMQGEEKDTDTAVHSLPVDAHVFIDPPQRVEIDDRSIYAENETLGLYQYTCCYYDGDKLLAEADYNARGRLTNLKCWEYDTAGNIFLEQTQSKTGEIFAVRHIYEYDSLDRKVHEKIYWDKNVIEDNYCRYTDEGCAGVKYSYLNAEWGEEEISFNYVSRIEYLADEAGNPLCVFKLRATDENVPDEVWKVQWAQRNGYMVNHIQYYDRYMQNRGDDYWYQFADEPHMKQVNWYEYNSETGEKNHILQLSYRWQGNQEAFVVSPPFYRVWSEGDFLLQEMNYSDEGLVYYSARQYDADGRLAAEMEYEVKEEEVFRTFHRYEYPEEERVEKYSYFIQGQEFSHLFEEGERILLTFSCEGVLTKIKMTDMEGELLEKYEFYEAGEKEGEFRGMYAGTEMITGETAILEEFSKEGERIRSSAGIDWMSYMWGEEYLWQ